MTCRYFRESGGASLQVDVSLCSVCRDSVSSRLNQLSLYRADILHSLAAKPSASKRLVDDPLKSRLMHQIFYAPNPPAGMQGALALLERLGVRLEAEGLEELSRNVFELINAVETEEDWFKELQDSVVQKLEFGGWSEEALQVRRIEPAAFGAPLREPGDDDDDEDL